MARQITHDLRVLGVESDGTTLAIDLHGGPSNACGSVRFTFNEPAEFDAHLALVKSWEQNDRPVALVTDTDRIVLMDEACFAAETEGAA